MAAEDDAATSAKTDGENTDGEDTDKEAKPSGDPSAAEQAKGAWASSDGETGYIPPGDVLRPGQSG